MFPRIEPVSNDIYYSDKRQQLRYNMIKATRNKEGKTFQDVLKEMLDK